MDEHQKTREYVRCKDGFTMSVQASAYHYCNPKVSGYNAVYNKVEIGFPTEYESLLKNYVEDLSGEDEDLDYTELSSKLTVLGSTSRAHSSIFVKSTKVRNLFKRLSNSCLSI